MALGLVWHSLIASYSDYSYLLASCPRGNAKTIYCISLFFPTKGQIGCLDIQEH